jgi:small subunit ribosomal protein S16
MSVRIRLQRCGKKRQPFYRVVIADGRAPRDGRFIEQIGTYNPLTHPATIVLDFDRAYHWVSCGAQPSDTARMILKREGIYLKKHLIGGVQKGAFTEEQAEEKLSAWKEDKNHKLNDAKLEILNSKKSLIKKRIEAETKIKEAKEAIVNEKRQAVLAAEAAKRAEMQAARTKPVEEPTETVEEVTETIAETTETIEEVTEIVAETTETVEEVTETVAKTTETVEEVTETVAETTETVEEVTETEETPPAE